MENFRHTKFATLSNSRAAQSMWFGHLLVGATLWFCVTGKNPICGRNIEKFVCQKSTRSRRQLKAARIPSSLSRCSLHARVRTGGAACRQDLQQSCDVVCADRNRDGRDVQKNSAGERDVLFIDIVVNSKLSINGNTQPSMS